MMAWALNESVNRKGQQSVHLTTKGVRTVFENIGRYRRAYLKEYIGAPTADYGHPTAPGAPASATAGQGKPQGWFGRGLDAIGRGVDKVGNYVSNVGHNVITKVTADKLNNMWNRAGEPYDSDRLYQLLTTEWGVPKEVVGSVYGKMGIPYTAPATVPNGTPAPQQQQQGGAADLQTGDIYNIDPSTGKPYGRNKLAADLAAKQAGAAQTSNTPAPTPGVATGRITKPANMTSITSNPAAFNAANVMQMKSIDDYAKPAAAAAKTANFGGGPTGYGKTTMSFKPPAAPAAPGAPKAPGDQKLTPNQYVKKIGAPVLPEETIKQVKKMLETVETRNDVTFIKKYINKEFQRHGLVSESAQTHRTHLLNEVTRIGALRRRSHSQQLAT